MTAQIGMVVQYMLSEDDVKEIQRRRTTGPEILARIKLNKWPLGAQAHVGDEVKTGDTLPMVITKILSQGGVYSVVNGRVILDGSDELWVRERMQTLPTATPRIGMWFEVPKA